MMAWNKMLTWNRIVRLVFTTMIGLCLEYKLQPLQVTAKLMTRDECFSHDSLRNFLWRWQTCFLFFEPLDTDWDGMLVGCNGYENGSPLTLLSARMWQWLSSTVHNSSYLTSNEHRLYARQNDSSDFVGWKWLTLDGYEVDIPEQWFIDQQSVALGGSGRVNKVLPSPTEMTAIMNWPLVEFGDKPPAALERKACTYRPHKFEFDLFRNRRAEGAVLAAVQVVHVLQCVTACTRNLGCRSFTYGNGTVCLLHWVRSEDDDWIVMHEAAVGWTFGEPFEWM